MTTLVQITLIICVSVLAALWLGLHYSTKDDNRKDDEE